MSNSPLQIRVTRQRVRRGNYAPWHNYVSGADTPDGKRFDNSSLVTLKQVLSRHYGQRIELIKDWES